MRYMVQNFRRTQFLQTTGPEAFQRRSDTFPSAFVIQHRSPVSSDPRTGDKGQGAIVDSPSAVLSLRFTMDLKS